MQSPKYFLYLAVGTNCPVKLDLTTDLQVDLWYLKPKGYQEILVLQTPVPIWLGESLLGRLQRIKLVKPEQFLRLAPRYLRESSQLQTKIERLAIDDLKVAFQFPESLELLSGRCLLPNEIEELLRLSKIELAFELESYLQYLYLNGVVKRQAAVSTDAWDNPICHRCGSKTGLTRSSCVFCGSKDCLTCTVCQNLGLAKSCLPLYTQPTKRSSVTGTTLIQPKLDFALTPPQQTASEKLLEFWQSSADEFLLWTVCGGGKTEVSMGIIAQELSHGGQVLVAIPRKDVVQELLPRFQSAFPEIALVALYGGSGGRERTAALTIATTHQTLRFYQAFDLIVLDEADAFPYQGSEMLHFALQRALKPQGKLVIMTATPDPLMLKAVRKGKLAATTIPARYHRQPLILPRLMKTRLKLPKLTPPQFIQKFLLESQIEKRKTLIFLPAIKLMEVVAPLWINWAEAQGIKGAAASSRTNEREALKMALVNGELDFLIVTTIFERGITIRNLNVLVWAADQEKIFNVRTLVQIAGRVGRHGEPGKVVFVGERISSEMKQAVKWIKQLNREGREKGYLE